VPNHTCSLDPPQAPELSGPYAQNSLLAGVERLDSGGAYAPETWRLMRKAAFTAAPKMVASCDLNPDGTHAVLFREIRGAAVGADLDHEGNLIVADANKGFALDRA